MTEPRAAQGVIPAVTGSENVEVEDEENDDGIYGKPRENDDVRESFFLEESHGPNLQGIRGRSQSGIRHSRERGGSDPMNDKKSRMDEHRWAGPALFFSVLVAVFVFFWWFLI